MQSLRRCGGGKELTASQPACLTSVVYSVLIAVGQITLVEYDTIAPTQAQARIASYLPLVKTFIGMRGVVTGP